MRSHAFRPLPWILLASLAANVWLVLETRSVAEEAGRAALVQQAQQGQLQKEQAALHAELLAWQERHQAMADELHKRQAELTTAAEARAVAAAQQALPMPEGVRLGLAKLHEALADEGFVGLRFLQARTLDEAGLHDVEVVEVSPDGLLARLYRVGCVSATLDRTTSVLELHLQDGTVLSGGERTELPTDGYRLRFPGVDGPALEARLSFLLRTTGSYPAVAQPASTPRVDPATRAAWLDRLDRLCDAAQGLPRWRVQRFANLRDGWFSAGQLVGTDARHHVVQYLDCEQFAVEVDAAAGLVSLRVRGGVLRQNGIDSKIGGEGLRMLLTHVDPKTATDLMLGMVVRKEPQHQ